MKKQKLTETVSNILLALWVIDIILSFFPVPQIPDIISLAIVIGCIITSALCEKCPHCGKAGFPPYRRLNPFSKKFRHHCKYCDGLKGCPDRSH